VYLIGHIAYEVLYITVGVVEVTLLELFNHHTFLYLNALSAEGEAGHAIRLKPEGSLHIVARERDVVVGEVIVGPCIVLATRQLYVGVIVGDVYRTLEHQMLQEVGITRMGRILVTCSYII
jgi:hypothetical protein